MARAHARAVMHVAIANALWREKRSRHSRRMRNPQFTYLVRSPWLVQVFNQDKTLRTADLHSTWALILN